MSEKPKALRLADALETEWSGVLLPTRQKAAAELRRLHAEVLEQCRLNGMGSEREAKLMAENEALQQKLRSTEATLQRGREVWKASAEAWSRDVDEKNALLRQALEALEADDWQKKMQASIDINRFLEACQ